MITWLHVDIIELVEIKLRIHCRRRNIRVYDVGYSIIDRLRR